MDIIILIIVGLIIIVLLNSNIKNQKIMAGELAAIKAKVEAQSAALDTVNTNVSGIQTDVTFLKQKIQDLQSGGGGATPEEIAELSTLVDGVSSKIDAIGAATASLDAETDSSQG